MYNVHLHFSHCLAIRDCIYNFGCVGRYGYLYRLSHHSSFQARYPGVLSHLYHFIYLTCLLYKIVQAVYIIVATSKDLLLVWIALFFFILHTWAATCTSISIYVVQREGIGYLYSCMDNPDIYIHNYPENVASACAWVVHQVHGNSPSIAIQPTLKLVFLYVVKYIYMYTLK